ncbi:MAG: hypothetical protein VX589_19475 [Myxococcota bacterium]|nr:hypothetical protein [Myxococcota bacterium]
MPRRQQERSAQTRQALLEGAITCLSEDGFRGFHGGRICERISLSRGALLHQYPTREAFLEATIDHILDQRLRETDCLLQAVRDAPNNVVKWCTIYEYFQTPVFIALNELLVGCRADAVLSAMMAEKYEQHRQNIVQLYQSRQPYSAANVPISIQLRVISYFFTGLLIDKQLPDPVPVETILAFLETLDRKLSSP